MKRIFLILFLISGVISAQNANIMSYNNSYIVDSTHPLLDSAEVFTGGVQSLIGYNSLSITIRSDKKGYLKILFGNTSPITTATAVKTYSFDYTANDTLFTKYLPADAPYYKVVYQNDSTAATGATQTKFYLITMLNRGHNLPITSNGKLDIDGTVTATISGVATANNQTTQITKADSTMKEVALLRSLFQTAMSRHTADSLNYVAMKTRLDSVASAQKNGLQKEQIVNSSGSNLFEGSYPGLTQPYKYFVRSIDTWGAAADTSSYNFNNDYLKCYVSIYDTSATADTLVIENYSYAKNNWTYLAIGFRDVYTDLLETDNSTVIIPAATSKTWEINTIRPGQIRIRPKTLTGRSTVKTKRIVFMGIN